MAEHSAGRNFKLTYGFNWPKHEPDPLARTAAQYVKQQVSLIVAFSNRAASAAKAATSSIPIIFLADEPVASGLVDSLKQPGGNLTGVTSPVSGLIARRSEIIRELVPAANAVVLVTDPTNKPTHDIEIREARAAAEAHELQLSIIAWTGEHDIEAELAALPRDRNAVLIFGGGHPFLVRPGTLPYLAMLYKLPAVHGIREAAEQGGPVSFGPRLADGGYLMGIHAARVLKGEKPADLPVQEMTRTEFVINLWGAKSLGLHIPKTLLACADEVIE